MLHCDQRGGFQGQTESLCLFPFPLSRPAFSFLVSFPAEDRLILLPYAPSPPPSLLPPTWAFQGRPVPGRPGHL